MKAIPCRLEGVVELHQIGCTHRHRVWTVEAHIQIVAKRTIAAVVDIQQVHMEMELLEAHTTMVQPEWEYRLQQKGYSQSPAQGSLKTE